MLDNFALIIGAMKSGTTSLFYHLKQHPQVSACTYKEPDFFTDNGKWAKGFEWYKNLWNWDSSIHRIALEATTNYTKMPLFPNAAERIATVKASFKFIYILRNPIDRIESQCNHALAYDGLKTIEELSTPFIALSMYATQLEEYYKRFPPQHILLLDFDDLKRDPLALLLQVCRFLELDTYSDYQGLHKKINAYKPKSAIHPVWNSLKRIPLLSPVNKLFPATDKDKFVLSTEQREFIRQELKDDMQKLYSEYEFDVSHWGFDVH